MKKGLAIVLAGTASIFALGFAPQVASAQTPAASDGAASDAPAEAAGSDNDIVVTAQRRGERLQRVPISISVVTAQAMQGQNIRTLESVSLRAPAVVVRPAPGGDQLHVRGMGSGFNPGFEQSVATFVDGVYRPRGRSSRIALFDVDRVELLKGPQTTYFGANAIAGALNITTRKPDDEAGMNFLAFYSPNLNEHNVEAGADLPLSPALSFRVAGRATGMDAVSRNERLGVRGEQNANQIRASVRYDAGGPLTIDGRFDYGRVRNTGDTALEIIGCPPSIGVPPQGQCLRSLNTVGAFDDRLDRRTTSGFLDRFNADFYEGALNASVDLGAARLVATTGYQDTTAGILIENINFPVPSVLNVPALLVTEQNEHHKQFSQEIRLESDLSGAIQYMVGGYYERGVTKEFTRLGFFQGAFGALAQPFFSPTDLIVSVANVRQESETLSGFGTITADLSSVFHVTAGLRYSRVEKSAHRTPFIGAISAAGRNALPRLDVEPGPIGGQLILAPILGAGLTDFVTPKRVDDEFMPSLNLRFTPSESFMAYASYIHGFKAGGYNFMFGADTFGPETVNSYELGLKSSFLDRRLTANLAIFQADYKDLQEAGNIFTPQGALIAFIGNVARSRSRGVEFAGGFRVSDALSLRMDVGYLDSKYRKYPNAPCSPLQSVLAAGGGGVCPQDLSGVRRANSPKWSGSAGFDYAAPVKDDLEFQVGGTVYFRSKYFLQTIPEDITAQSGFAKIDLRVGLANSSQGWDLAIIGQNITDKTTASFLGHAPTAPGTLQGIAERGRSVGLQFSIKLGGAQ